RAAGAGSSPRLPGSRCNATTLAGKCSAALRQQPSLPAECPWPRSPGFSASGSWVATGSTTGRSTVVLYGGLGQGFLDHRAAAAAPYGLGGSEDQTSR